MVVNTTLFNTVKSTKDIYETTKSTEVDVPKLNSFAGISEKEALEIIEWGKSQGYGEQQCLELISMRDHEIKVNARASEIKRLSEQELNKIKEQEQENIENVVSDTESVYDFTTILKDDSGDKEYKIQNGEWSVVESDGSNTPLNLENDAELIANLDTLYPNAKNHANEKTEGTNNKQKTNNSLNLDIRNKNLKRLEEYEKRKNTSLDDFVKNHYNKNAASYWANFKDQMFYTGLTNPTLSGVSFLIGDANSSMEDIKKQYDAWIEKAYVKVVKEEVIDPGSFISLSPELDYSDINNVIQEDEEPSSKVGPITINPHLGYEVKQSVVDDLAEQGFIVKNNWISQAQYEKLQKEYAENLGNKDANVSNLSQYWGETIADMVAIARDQDLYEEFNAAPNDAIDKKIVKIPNIEPGKYVFNGETYNFTEEDVERFKKYQQTIKESEIDKFKEEEKDRETDRKQKSRIEYLTDRYNKEIANGGNGESTKGEIYHTQSKTSMFFDDSDLEDLDIDLDDFENYVQLQLRPGGILHDLDVKAFAGIGADIGLYWNQDKMKYEYGSNSGNSQAEIHDLTAQVLNSYLYDKSEELNEQYEDLELRGFFDIQDNLEQTTKEVKLLKDYLNPIQIEYDNLKKNLDEGIVEKTQENINKLNELATRINTVGEELNQRVNFFNNIINDPYNMDLAEEYGELVSNNTKLQNTFNIMRAPGRGGVISEVNRELIKKNEASLARSEAWYGVPIDMIEETWNSLVSGGVQLTGTIGIETVDTIMDLFGDPMDPKKKARAYNYFKKNAEFSNYRWNVEYGGATKENGDLNWAAIPGIVSSTVADMYMMSGAGGLARKGITGSRNLIANGSKRLGIDNATRRYLPKLYGTFKGSANVLGRNATVNSIYNRATFSLGAAAVIHPRNVEDAMFQVDEDFSYDDAFNAANERTFWESMVEAINPDINLLAPYKRLKDKDFKNYKEWKSGANPRKIFDIFTDNIGQLPAEILEENLQEWINGTISARYNRTHNTDFHMPTAEDYKALNIITPLSVLVAGGIRTKGFTKGRTNPALYQQAIENMEDFKKALQAAVDNPDIDFTQDEMDDALVEAQAYLVAKAKIPFEEYNKMNNEQRQETLSLLVQQEKLNKQIQDLSLEPASRARDEEQAKLARDLKNTRLRLKKVANYIQTEFKSAEEQEYEYELALLKARWKSATNKKQYNKSKELWDEMEKVRKKRDLARDESSPYEFNGKAYANAAEFIEAINEAANNGFFNKPGGMARIRINNKVNPELAEYVSRKVNRITGAKVYKGGEVLMNSNSVEEAEQYMAKQENAGKSLEDYKNEYSKELQKKKRDATVLNNLRNAINYLQYTDKGYVNNTDAGGMVMFGDSGLNLREIAERRLDRKIESLKNISENSDIGIRRLDRNTIAKLIADGVITDERAVYANAFVMAQVDPETGRLKQVLVLNEDAIFDNKANSALTHELLHAILFSTLNGEVRIVEKDGIKYKTRLTEKGAELIRGFLNLLPKNQLAELEASMIKRGYITLDENGDIVEPFEVYAEEFITVFHDLVVNEKKIQNRPDTRSTLNKIKDYFVNFFKSKTEEDMHSVIETNLKTPEQLLEFLRTFNTQSISGKFSDEIMEMAASSQDFYGDVVKEEGEDLTESFSLSERSVNEQVTQEQRERLVQRVNEIYADPNKSIDQKAALIAEEYRGMAEVRFEVALATAPSTQIRDILINNKEDVIAQMLYDPGDGKNKARNVLGLVRDFELERQKYKNIAAYINKYFRVRSYEVISDFTKDKMFKKQFEEAQGALQETEATETLQEEENQFAAGQIVVTDKLTQVDPFNELLKDQIDDYNNDISSQVLIDPNLYTSKTYKTLKDLNPRKTIERMVNDQMVNGAYGKVYVDNGSPFWKTPKGREQLGTPIVDGILKKLKNNDNLNQQDIRALQPYISKHASTLKIGLPQGFMTDKNNKPTTATGVQQVLLDPFYNKGSRIGNIFPQRKKTNIGITEFLDVFGITPAGEVNIVGKESNVSQRIKALIEQHGRLTTNQQVRKTLLETGVSEDVVNDIANGKSNLAFSLNSGSDFNPETQQIEPGFSFSEAQYINALIRAYHNDRSTYEFLSQADPVMASIVEDVFINPNISLGQGEKYITSLMLDKFTPKGFVKNNFKGKSYIGPKLFDSKQPNKVGDYQETYVKEAVAFAQTIHPNVPSNVLKFILGFKTGKTISPTLYPGEISQIENRVFEGNLTQEEAELIKAGIKVDILGDAVMMINSGEIANIINDIVSQPTLALKQQKRDEYKDRISEINDANENLMKYIAFKMKQAYKNNLVSDHFVYFNGQIQTNIIEGTRALSTFEYMYLIEGQQVPLKNNKFYKKPLKNKRSNLEYYNSQDWNDYVMAFKEVEEWGERETINRRQLKEKGKVKVGNKSIVISDSITDKTLDLETAVIIATMADLSWKNEHVGASATTHAERSSYIYSDGKSIDLNNFANDHRSAWLPTYLADKYLDAKIEIGGKMVDNKVSYEGPMRMTKFAKNKFANIFHYTGDGLVDYLVKVEKISNLIEDIRERSDLELDFESERVEAVQQSLMPMSMSRGMSTFDFDETLIDKGENFIIATKGDEVIKISSGQWPLQGPQLAEQGYEFNFDDFINVRGGVEGPLMQKFRNQIEKYGVDNVFILTARPQEAAPAIHAWLQQQGIDLPIENITALGDGRGVAKAKWMLQKFAEGYNDMYFVDDALPNVEAVKHVLDQLDIKSNVQQVRTNFSLGINSNLNDIINSNVGPQLDLNRIIEQTKGVRAETTYSDAQAKVRGSKKGKWAFFVPPSAEDFKGLIYRFVGKGRLGEQHMAFFKKALFDPFARAMNGINTNKQKIQDQYRQLLKTLPNIKNQLKQLVPNTNFTQEQAVRVYLWNRGGYNVPGLSQRDLDALVSWVRTNPELKSFADQLSKITNQPVGYIEPSEYWTVENILSDLLTLTNEINRDQYLAEFKANRAQLFGEWQNGKIVGDNMNKVEAIYGTRFRDALEDALWHMEFGTKREQGSNRLVNAFNNWANQSVGAIMFFQMRSALLQTISSINYINWSDNNPLKAGAALLNFPQFLKDFTMLFNSDMLRQRRAGNQRGINEAELAKAVSGVDVQSRVKAMLHWLLTKGFLPTQIADSFAIASGGALFYRNRLNSYLKKGFTEQQAKKKAFEDFQEVTEESQQSSRPDMLSQQQRSPLGRYILAFKNTPMQYARLMKKAWLDIINGRGDFKTNLSKIIYYGVVQNLIFNALQAALGVMIGSEDDEEEIAKKQERVLNGMIDSLLGGLGIGGNAVVTIKNSIREYLKQRDKDWGADHTYTMLQLVSFSPTVGSKLRKIYSAIQTEKYNEDVIKEMSAFDIDNPMWSAWANVISGVTNLPLDRIVKKVDNIDAAITEDITELQRLALIMGWNTWDLGIKDQDIIAIEEEIKERKDKDKKKKKSKKKKDKDKDKEKENKDKEKENRRKNDGRCVAISKSGERCKREAINNGYCTIHEKKEQRPGGKRVQCKKIKSDKQRCKMKTSNKSGYCYYHD